MTGRHIYQGLSILLWCLLFFAISVQAQEELCAEVKIEIKQELTFERQGFEALMRIENSLDSFTLEDIAVTVYFKDALGQTVTATSNTAASDAEFFIRLDATRDITGLTEGQDGAVSGGRIAPQEVGEMRWLIIPTSAAAGNSQNGELYFVGAQLSYSYGGKEESLEVASDSIVVKPQPALTLDYFLTREIIGDDAFTPEVEPPEPYTLGVRVSNSGYGYAGAVKIESAQPTIVENEQGLAIDFTILESYRGNEPAAPTLIINFGDMAPQDVAVGRWVMESSLSGEFTAFSASFTHADELGGELTSLLQATNARFLLRDVLVDASGRDNVRDFLAHNEHQELYVYESEFTGLHEALCTNCAPVEEQPGTIASAGGGNHRVTYEAIPGFTYTRVPDPYNGTQVLGQVVRSDGKPMSPRNAWLSKVRADDDRSFDYYVNIFDSNTTGEYVLQWGGGVSDVPQPPAIAFMVDRVTYEGGQVGFLVRASDPNDTVPALSVQQLPVGATFEDKGDGTGVFNWSPVIGQSGVYPLTFQASDGQLSDTRSMTIRVNPHDDIDGDGMNDAWEREHFGDLDRDGTGDFDGDGRTDLEEYEDGTDPRVSQVVPGMPQILSPTDDAEVLDGAEAPWLPELAVTNGSHSGEIGPVAVVFEVYAEEALTTLIATATAPEGEEETAIQLAGEHLQEGESFADNRLYYWRARSVIQAQPGVGSGWVKGRFFINSANDAPTAPTPVSPENNSEIDSSPVTLVVANGEDIDRDQLYYSFALYEDANLETPLAAVSDMQGGGDGQTEWTVPRVLNAGTGYVWQAVVTDEHGLQAASDWMSFTLAGEEIEAPRPPVVVSPADGTEITESTAPVELVVSNATDPAGYGLEYEFELDTHAEFTGEHRVASGRLTEGEETTRWLTPELADHTTYYWRARAHNGFLPSPWVTAQFTVSLAVTNSAPPLPVLNQPLDGATLEVLRPYFELNPVTDVDGDAVSYRFEIYTDAELTGLLLEHTSAEPYWQLEEPLVPGTPYYWRYQSVDSQGNSLGWSEPLGFVLAEAATNEPPVLTLMEPKGRYRVVAGYRVPIQWTDEDPDSSAVISLYYHRGGQPPVLIAEGLPEDADGDGDHYEWDTTGLKPGKYSLQAVIEDEDTRATVGPWGHINIRPWVCSRPPTDREKQQNHADGAAKPDVTGRGRRCVR